MPFNRLIKTALEMEEQRANSGACQNATPSTGVEGGLR